MIIELNNGQVQKIKEEDKKQDHSENNKIEEPHSVKFAINSYGRWSSEVKCYGKTPDEALKEAYRISLAVEVILKDKNTTSGFEKTWKEVNK